LERPEVEVALLSDLKAYGLSFVPNESALDMLVHETVRLGPTLERPTVPWARRTGKNSTPLWEEWPDPSPALCEQPFEFRNGVPCVVDTSEVAAASTIFTASEVDKTDDDSGMPSSCPLPWFPHIQFFDDVGGDFEADLLPDWAARDRRRHLLGIFARLLLEFHKHTTKRTACRDYWNLLDRDFDSLTLALRDAYAGMVREDVHTIVDDLLEIGENGLPQAGSHLRKAAPPHRFADCGIRAFVKLMTDLDTVVPDGHGRVETATRADGRVTIFHYSHDGRLALKLAKRPVYWPKNSALQLLDWLVNMDRKPPNRAVIPTSQLEETWSSITGRASSGVAKQPGNRIHSICTLREIGL
jgi:hypothetical protein